MLLLPVTLKVCLRGFNVWLLCVPLPLALPVVGLLVQRKDAVSSNLRADRCMAHLHTGSATCCWQQRGRLRQLKVLLRRLQAGRVLQVAGKNLNIMMEGFVGAVVMAAAWHLSHRGLWGHACV